MTGEVFLGAAAPTGVAWAVSIEGVVLSAAVTGPPAPSRLKAPVRARGQQRHAALDVSRLPDLLFAWAPVDLVLADPADVLRASARLRAVLAALARPWDVDASLTVVFGDHRFDLADRLDRALWRLLTAGWARPPLVAVATPVTEPGALR